MYSLSGKVFITGGTGFLGRGILRRAQRENWDCEFVVYSRDEYKQWQCKNRFKDVRIRYVLGDVRDDRTLELAMQGADSVIHTAAIKFIPEAEFNVAEAIAVNLDGSASVFDVARRCEVDTVVAISTDKAPRPINVYGMTKALVERLLGEYAAVVNNCGGITKYVGVRYGNVIGSTGSVIPLFQDQLAKTGRVTVTDQDMTRFWITVDEAIDLILYAIMYCNSGDIAIPMPKAMTIGNLARCLTDYKNIDEIGIRPGERKHECMLTEEESLRAYEHGFVADPTNTRYFVLGSVQNHQPQTAQDRKPFSITSDKVKWFTPDEMMAAIADAAGV